MKIEKNNSIYFFNRDLSNKNILKLKGIHFYNCVIVYVRNAILSIKKVDGCVISVPEQSICYMEKNTVMDVTVNVLGPGKPYDIFHLDSQILTLVCKTMEPFLINQHKVSHPRTRIFSFQADETDIKIFERLIKSNPPQYRQVYKIMYLFSKIKNFESLVNSLSVSTNTTFTEKIKMIIESELSKSWRLVDISCIMHMSEVTIKKKLEKEKNNFNKLVLDIKMHNAAKLITTTDIPINHLANKLGYTSTSYFIKNFREYFGITPKQFALKLKNHSG
ncbi:AraC family transcriptional regulator [Escherichia coli B9:H18]|uniref:AraC family transcriptional regulator n=1 Tax=Escherichia coli TaxID=562 RepID=UPI00067CC2C8|nr:AraC family transcriptional regulator [Escherichia coli]